MKIKLVAFLALGGVASYYGANFSLVDTPEMKIEKNYFTSSYTVEMPDKGLVIKYDKRYEGELGAITDVLRTVIKYSEDTKQENQANNERLRHEAQEKISNIMKIR
jgi:hypothetical protein